MPLAARSVSIGTIIMDRLDTIAVFVAVAERESFAAAARHLNRTPASVTRAVADLEDHLRARLLNRTTRSVSLTDAGDRYLETARRLLEAYAELRGMETDGKAEPHGALGVTAPANFGRLHVIPLVSDFLARYRSVQIRLLLVDRVVSLVEEGLDVGVRLGELPDSALRATRAGSVRRGIYASPAYLQAHGAPASLAEVAEHPVVSATAISPVPERWSFDGAAGPQSVAVQPRLIVNTTNAAADAAARGVGLVLLVSYQAAHLVASGELRQVLPEQAGKTIPIHIVQTPGRFTSATVRAFIDEAAQALRRQFPDP